MATREAILRMRFDGAAFNADLKTAADRVKRGFDEAGRAAGSSLKRGIGAGFGAAKSSIAGLGGQLKQALGYAVTLGGAVSLGAFARQAVDAEEKAGAVAAQLRRMGQGGATAASVLDDARVQAEMFQSTIDGVLGAHHALLASTGEPAFSREAIENVTRFAQAFRITEQESAELVATLHKKLGATNQEIRDEFGPALLDATNRGGIGIGDLVARGNDLLKIMPTIGLSGAVGFRQLVGMLNATDTQGGNVESRISGMREMLVKLSDGSPILQRLLKDIRRFDHGFKFQKGEDAITRLKRIVSAKGGIEALKGALEGEAKLMLEPLLGPAAKEALEQAQGDVNKARALTAEIFQRTLNEASAATSNAATVQEEAARRQEEKSQRMKVAIDRMAAAFTKPEILDSMDKLAAALPPLAEGFSKLVNLVVANPALAAAGVVAGKVAVDAAAASAGSLLKDVGKSLGKGAASVGGAAMQAGTASSAAAVGAGTMALGATAALVGGAVVGDLIRTHTIDPEQRRQQEILNVAAYEAQSQAEGALSSDDTARKVAALAAVRRARTDVESTRGGVTDWLNRAGSALIPSGGKGPEELRREHLAKLAEEERALTEQLDRRKRAEERAVAALDAQTRAMERFASASRGVNKPPAAVPGTAGGD